MSLGLASGTMPIYFGGGWASLNGTFLDSTTIPNLMYITTDHRGFVMAFGIRVIISEASKID